MTGRHHPPPDYKPGTDARVDGILNAIGRVVQQAERDLRANPTLLVELLSPAEFRSALPQPRAGGRAAPSASAAAAWGKAIERHAHELASRDPVLRGEIDYQRTISLPGGKHGFLDFAIKPGGNTPHTPVDITTPRAAAAHSSRQYGPWLHQFTHETPPNVRAVIASVAGLGPRGQALAPVSAWPTTSRPDVLEPVAKLSNALDDARQADREGRHDEAYTILRDEIPALLNSPDVQVELEGNRDLANAVHSTVMTLDTDSRGVIASRADRGLAVANPRWDPEASPVQKAVNTVVINSTQHLADPRDTARLPSWGEVRGAIAANDPSQPSADVMPAVADGIGRSPGFAFATAKDEPGVLLDVLATSGPRSPDDRYAISGALPMSSKLSYAAVSDAVNAVASANNPGALATAMGQLSNTLAQPDTAVFTSRHDFVPGLVDSDTTRIADPHASAPPPAVGRTAPLTLDDLQPATPTPAAPTPATPTPATSTVATPAVVVVDPSYTDRGVSLTAAVQAARLDRGLAATEPADSRGPTPLTAHSPGVEPSPANTATMSSPSVSPADTSSTHIDQGGGTSSISITP